MMHYLLPTTIKFDPSQDARSVLHVPAALWNSIIYALIAAPLVEVGAAHCTKTPPMVDSIEVATVAIELGGPDATIVIASDRGPHPHLFLDLILN